jgi:predicted ArsR family transcriptional regulator
MPRAPISSGRYTPVVVNGHRQWARDQVALRAEILALLTLEDGLPKKRIIMTLGTAQAAVDTALSALLQTGEIERYRARSIRGRMDEHWCLAGRAPAAPRNNSSVRYNAIAILTAMQQHAASIHTRSATK